MSKYMLLEKSKLLVNKLTINGVVHPNVVINIEKIKPIEKEWFMGNIKRRIYGKECIHINLETGSDHEHKK